MSQRDVELARQISAAVHGLGVPADPTAVQNVTSHDRRARRSRGPSIWWVLADTEGNDACVATWMDRD